MATSFQVLEDGSHCLVRSDYRGRVVFLVYAPGAILSGPTTWQLAFNCHIMGPYYATWMHSSHGRDATCNDCHVPHENPVKKWAFKGMDGMRHVAVFLTRGEHQVIKANDESAEVIMNNCIRCHTQLNTEFVSTGRINYMMSQVGEGKACWDCHRDVAHGQNSLSTTPDALVPYPESPAPEWLRKMINK